MSPSLSIAIPARNEEKSLPKCLDSIRASARASGHDVDVVVALNRCTDRTQQIAESWGARCVVEDAKCIASVRNAAVRATSTAWVATLDADSWMAPGTVAAVMNYLGDPRFIGGGTAIWPERWSLGIVCSLLVVAPHLLRHRVSAGMFWFARTSFEAIGGFNESLVSAEDLDFARRLKAFGLARGQRYGTVRRHGITTSCRKFDRFGDWYLFRNPHLVRRILEGKDRQAADHFYYDIER